VFEAAMLNCDETGKFDISSLNEEFDPDAMGRITSMVVRRQQLKDNSTELLCGMIERLRDEKRRRNTDADSSDRLSDILASQRKKLKKE